MGLSRHPYWFVYLLLWLPLSLWIKNTSSVASDDSIQEGTKDCPLWLAPSYTGTEKEPRYGLFAGRSYQENETLPNSELAIPLIDFVQNYNRRTPLRHFIMEFIESHLWTSEYAGSGWEGNLSAPVIIPGIGVLPQYHSGMANVDFLRASVLLRDKAKAPKSGTPHPSRGAITTYHNVTLKAIQPVPAGMELFASFGDVWDGNYTDDSYQDKIRRYDYQDADKIVNALVEFYQEFPDLSLDLQEDILEFVLTKVLGTAVGKHAKTIKSLIPENPRKLKKVLEAGGTFMYRYPDIIRSTEWLSKNGFCLNTLKSGPSTIPFAGRGAFANRNIASGQIITITPMMHIADRDLMTMYPIKTFLDDMGQPFQDYDRSQGPIGEQILLNYCFGHPESSLLLFPLGSLVTLVNHHRTAPNAYITWSRVKDNGLSNHHVYHDYTVVQLAQVDKIVIVMKLVAIRDIGEDEEIFIDYGSDWERVWQDYQKRWEQWAAFQPHPWQAEDLRQKYRNRPLETAATLYEHRYYPPNVATGCFLQSRDRPDGLPMHDGAFLSITEWAGTTSWDWYKGNQFFIVDVLDRHEAPGFFYNYTVIARFSPTRLEQIVNVPHEACTFVNRPYTSDIHFPGAFRHPIGIIDSHFPQMWRDRR